MADSTTHAALRAHMDLWRKGDGFNANPLADLGEQVRWLCDELDRRAEPSFFEEESSRIARAIKRREKAVARG